MASPSLQQQQQPRLVPPPALTFRQLTQPRLPRPAPRKQPPLLVGPQRLVQVRHRPRHQSNRQTVGSNGGGGGGAGGGCRATTAAVVGAIVAGGGSGGGVGSVGGGRGAFGQDVLEALAPCGAPHLRGRGERWVVEEGVGVKGAKQGGQVTRGATKRGLDGERCGTWEAVRGTGRGWLRAWQGGSGR